MTAQVQSTDPSKDEALIEALVEEQTVSWNKGDAHAFSAKCTEDVSFTNIAGTSRYGRAAFEQRHAELFAGIFKGSIRTQSIEKLRFLREDVAVADVKMELRGYETTSRHSKRKRRCSPHEFAVGPDKGTRRLAHRCLPQRYHRPINCSSLSVAIGRNRIGP